MDKTKFSVFRKSGEPMTIEQAEIPQLKRGEILVKNEYATLCRSDISTYLGKRIEKNPTTLGHEIVGRVVSIYNDATVTDCNGEVLEIGDRITWAIYASDPADDMSLKGIPQKAKGLFKYGHEQITECSLLHGGFAEHTIVREFTPIIKLDNKIPLKVASIINCAVSTVSGALRLAGDVSDRRVAVIGAGMLGIICCAMCREYGATEVIAVDIDQSRLDTAKRFGATQVIKSGSSELEALKVDVSLEFSGIISCMEQAVDMLSIGGVSVWVGGVCPQPNVGLDSERIIRNLLTIKGLHNYNKEDFVSAVAFLNNSCEKYPFEELIFDGFSLDQIEEAFQYAIQNNPHRVGVYFK